MLSPLVTGLSFEYYNAGFDSWQNYSTLQRDSSGQWELPNRLRLRFTYGRMTRETIIALPAVSQALPLF